MMRRWIPVLAIALLAGCSSGLNRPVHEVTAKIGGDGVQHVRVTAHSYWFDPNRIVVQANQPVELRLHNHAWFVPHNLTITEPDAGITVSVDVGGIFHRTRTVRFTPTTPGEYHFGCHVDSHGKKGMRGTLVVQ